MSGTSMDGIDISLVKTNGCNLIRLNKNYFHQYSTKTKEDMIKILKEDITFNLKRKKLLDDFVTYEHYLALKDLDIVKACDLIGFHGQTIYHSAEESISVQLGNPKKLAEMLNKNVVFDFRSNDIVSGGQGAPLAPIYHKFIIEKLNLDLPSCIINIGGISNLTYWDGEELIGFDTGPGNSLMDDYSLHMFNKDFDQDGIFASKGIPIKEEVKKFLELDYFKRQPPKSLDRMSFKYLYKKLLKKKYSIYDTMATLSEFTSASIVASLNILPKKVSNIIITGGGYKNLHLMQMLRNKLKLNFLDEKQLGIEFDYLEAELIAYLSARSIYKLPFTFPLTTGVLKPLSGGKLYECS